MVDTLYDITSALQTYVVSPLNAFGLGGFIFDVQTEEMALLSADITDHYTEDNRALQDHIAIRPKRITLKGYVGELVYDSPNGNSATPLQIVTQKLTELSGFLPQLSSATIQAQAAITGIDSAGATLQSLAAAVPAGANIYGLVKNAIGATSGNQQKQQSAYQFFSACQSGGILMGVQTPWEFLTNMAIETIVAIQPEDSVFLTDFAITLKQIRIATTETAISALSGTGGVPSVPQVSQGANAIQAAPQSNIGIVPGQATSFLPTTPQGFVNALSQ